MKGGRGCGCLQHQSQVVLRATTPTTGVAGDHAHHRACESYLSVGQPLIGLLGFSGAKTWTVVWRKRREVHHKPELLLSLVILSALCLSSLSLFVEFLYVLFLKAYCVYKLHCFMFSKSA